MFPLSDISNSKMRVSTVNYNIFNNEMYFLCIIFLNCSLVNRKPISIKKLKCKCNLLGCTFKFNKKK